MIGLGQVASRSPNLTTGKTLFNFNFQAGQKKYGIQHLISVFDQGGQAGREGRGLHWDPERLLPRRNQVARH